MAQPRFLISREEKRIHDQDRNGHSGSASAFGFFAGPELPDKGMSFQMFPDGPLQDPLTETVDDDHLVQPAQGGLIQEGFQPGKGFVHPEAD